MSASDSPIPLIGGVVILEVGGAVGIPAEAFIPVVEAAGVVAILTCGYSETRMGLKLQVVLAAIH